MSKESSSDEVPVEDAPQVSMEVVPGKRRRVKRKKVKKSTPETEEQPEDPPEEPPVEEEPKKATRSRSNSGAGQTRKKKIVRRHTVKTSIQKQTQLEEVPMYLPDTFKSDAESNPLIEFVNSCFNSQVSGGLFSKKHHSPEMLSSFALEPPNLPVLQSTTKKLYKPANLMFKSMLKYAGARPSKVVKGTLQEYVGYMTSDPLLVDECYAILLKQSNDCPPEYYSKMMELFLVAIAFKCPSSEICPYIKSQLARLSKTDKEYAPILYLRFLQREIAGDPEQPPPDIEALPEDFHNENMMFNISLYECMIHQHKRFPRLKIPYPMHCMTQRLLDIGAEKQSGIFRVVGSLKNIENIIEKAHHGEDYLAGLGVNDVSSIFKHWCRGIQGGIIDTHFIDDFMKLKAGAQMINFVNNLPDLNRNTLKYLVGFLQRMSRSCEITLMDIPNLAMVFSMNIIIGGSDPMLVTKISTQASILLRYLIENWVVTDIYPLPDVALV